MKTRKALFAVLLGIACAIFIAQPASAANIVLNPGFETGAFAPSWVQGGNLGFTGVDCAGGFGPPHGGACQAFMGPIGSDGTLTQTLATVAGELYDFSFWLRNLSGAPPNNFSASFGGATVYSIVNAAAFGYTQISFLGLPGTGAATQLQFAFRHDPSFFNLDDVVVEQVPEPASMLLLGTGFAGLAGAARRRMKKANKA